MSECAEGPDGEREHHLLCARCGYIGGSERIRTLEAELAEERQRNGRLGERVRDLHAEVERLRETKEIPIIESAHGLAAIQAIFEKRWRKSLDAAQARVRELTKE